MNQGQQARLGKAPAERIRFRLNSVSRVFDPRHSAIRPDLADISLAQSHFAPHYAAAVPLACTARRAAVRGKPDFSAQATTELLHGEGFLILDVRGDWAWGYCGHDHYVGYVPRASVGLPTAPTHRVVHAAPVFSVADIKAPVSAMLPVGSLIAGTVEGAFLAIDTGFIHLRHVVSISQYAADWVAVARQYLGQPYIWGGRGGDGVDCSGLVQMALMACGIQCPRDSDEQAQVLGGALDDEQPAKRGDFIFFPGHVGIMADDTNLLHANAHWMSTMIEPLADVVARLAPDHAQPIMTRRRISS